MSDPVPSPTPRTGWGIFLLLVLLVAGIVASRHWIGAQRSAPSASAVDWRMTVAAPSGTVIHEPTRFEVAIRRADGLPVEGARVEFDLTMPAMEMPLNRFGARAVPDRPGTYAGEGTFTMKGKWQIEAIARHGDQVARARRIVQQVR